MMMSRTTSLTLSNFLCGSMHVTILYDYDNDEKIYILSSLSLSLSLIMAPWIKISSHILSMNIMRGEAKIKFLIHVTNYLEWNIKD